MASKSSNTSGVIVPTLKEQALAHWKDNLERLRKMDWDKWIDNYYGEQKRDYLLYTNTDKYPQIGGRNCPYCQEYGTSCRITTHHVCPLYEQGTTEGSCCKEWRAVYNALVWGKSKEKAIEAMEAMIRRIESD